MSSSESEEEDNKETHLLRQGVSHGDVIWVVWLLANVVRDIRRLGSSRFILEAPEISLDLVQICLQLHLMGKRDIRLGILFEAGVSRTIHHHPKVRICLHGGSIGCRERDPELDGIAC